jgi:hypothetical protein
VTEINGLPAHVLLVHAVIVLVPATALAVVLAALWPAARARLGGLLPVLALGTLALVPLTTSAGEALLERTFVTDLVRRHTELGRTLWPWVVGLLVLAVAIWWLDGASGRRSPGDGPLRLDDRRTRAAVAVVSLLVAAGAVVTVVRVGESGTRSVWEGRLDDASETG